ncbi:MAG: hypothetical protein ACO1QB_14490 [Verrucomicrobiales bacterium]
MTERLKELLLDLSGLTEEEAYQKGEAVFRTVYTLVSTKGSIRDYLGNNVEFHLDRYHHGFRTSPDRAQRAYSKDKIAIERIERIYWIKAILQGEIIGTECWLVRPKEGRIHPLDRAFVVWNPGYIIWLWPRKDENAWRFSSAYPVPPQELRRYLRGGRLEGRL